MGIKHDSKKYLKAIGTKPHIFFFCFFLMISHAAADLIIDNDGPGTSYSGGFWGYSSGSDPYGENSRAENRSGAIYTFEGIVTGEQNLSMWWTYWSSRCTAVPIDIYDGATLLNTVWVNQQQQSLAG